MGSKKEESIHSLDQLQVPTTLDKFIEELPERYVEGQINKEVEEQIDTEWKAFQNDLKKKATTFRKKVVIFPYLLQQLLVFSLVRLLYLLLWQK